MEITYIQLWIETELSNNGMDTPQSLKLEKPRAKPVLEMMKKLYIPEFTAPSDSSKGSITYQKNKTVKIKKNLNLNREIMIREMFKNQIKRQKAAEEVDQALKAGLGILREQRLESHEELNRTGNIPSYHRKKLMRNTIYNPNLDRHSLCGSSRTNPKRFSGVTGINTYLYEVNANPMKELLKSSVHKRRKKLFSTINSCFRSTARSKIEQKRRYKSKNLPQKKFNYSSKISSDNSQNMSNYN
ncbi:unnamed protein product [Moneuplotes crassus]|uniref:Uncharacterized protein n=1 Tax=Euplotes crassus TaxID=5936 RepID=A0AAD1UFN6_EUPCR|nr:unnamed protein product [Moneuplotes crassus]